MVTNRSKVQLVLNELTSKDKKSYLSLDDNGYSKRIDNQLRLKNVNVWHCATTVFALYIKSVNEFEYEVSKEIADIFLSNEKFNSKLKTSNSRMVALALLKYPYSNSKNYFYQSEQTNSRQEQIALADKVFLYLFLSVLFVWLISLKIRQKTLAL